MTSNAAANAGSSQPITCDIMVTNGCVLTIDGSRRIFAPGAVAVAGRRIAAVGPEAEIRSRYRAARTFDARGAVVHPGFVDPHLHIVHGTCRGPYSNAAVAARQAVPFADWKADVTPDDEHVATGLAGLELLRHGFTCFVEPGSVFDGDAVAAAAEAVGVRCMLAGPYLWDQLEVMAHMGELSGGALFRRVPADLDRCLDQLGRELHRNRDPDALVRGYVSVYGLGTASDRLLKEAKSRADSAGVIFQQHEGYAPEGSAEDRRRLGRSRLAHLRDLGVLDQRSTLIHMSVMHEDEVAPVRETGMSLVWCPVQTLRLALGRGFPCRLPGLANAGVNVALGVDGALDLALGTVGSLAFHMAYGVGDPITPEQVLEMQTISAARTIGLEGEIGSLEPGKRADLVIRNRCIESYPGVNPVQQLALTVGQGSVETVIVDGQVVMHAGTSTRLDEQALAEEARASVLRRIARLGVSDGASWPTVA